MIDHTGVTGGEFDQGLACIGHRPPRRGRLPRGRVNLFRVLGGPVR